MNVDNDQNSISFFHSTGLWNIHWMALSMINQPPLFCPRHRSVIHQGGAPPDPLCSNGPPHTFSHIMTGGSSGHTHNTGHSLCWSTRSLGPGQAR